MKHFFSLFAVTADNLGLPRVPVDDVSVSNAITVTYTVVGALSLLFIIIGSIRYITANGEASNFQKAKFTILYAVIGMVLALSAFVIVQFVAGSIQ